MSRIEVVYPQNPYEPTVQYAGAIQAPFAVPWTAGRAWLGAGFHTQRKEGEALFMEPSAFHRATETPLRFTECQNTSIKDDSQSDMAVSSENTTFAINASVGGSLLGASGRGSYDKTLRENNNNSNISVRAEHTCGLINMVFLPALTADAVELLDSAADPAKAFRQTYGDFYVAGYRIGALNNTSISGQLANKSFFEAKHAELKVKALFTFHKSIHEVQQSGSDQGKLQVCLFDSVEHLNETFTVYTEDDSVEAARLVADNRQRALNIARRVAETLQQEFALQHGCELQQDTVDRLCDHGFVTELFLAPFNLLREYRARLSLRTNRLQHQSTTEFTRAGKAEALML